MSSESAPDRSERSEHSTSNWRPTASWENLRRRAQLLRRLREFFDNRQFLEVETPVLSTDTVIDRHLEPMTVAHPDGSIRFLQTSPEFAMKRLVAHGAQAIYQVTRAFRGDEVGPLHNPEFTMVEWYRTGDSADEAIRLLSDLAETMLNCAPAELVSYRDAFRNHLGLDPHTASFAELRAAAAELDGDSPEFGEDNDGWLCYLLTHAIEPRLGVGEGKAVILFDYPASQSALAQVRPDSTGQLVAKRFELYFDGIELANGYLELQDADELRRRNDLVNQQRLSDSKPQLPGESKLLAAMEHGLPSCCGVALGFDRLVMCAIGATSLDEVTTFGSDDWQR